MHLELGSVAELIGGVASIVGTLLSIVALISARRANRALEVSKREAAERDLERSRREEKRVAIERDREARESAGTLQVWWASEQTIEEGKEKDMVRGLVISNEGASPTVFRDLKIYFTDNGVEKETNNISLIVPGRHFYPNVLANLCRSGGEAVRYIPKKQSDWLRPVEPGYCYTPFAEAKNYLVKRLEYKDHIGRKWQWTPETGLQEF